MKRLLAIFLLTAATAAYAYASFFCRVRNFAADNGLLQAHISNAQQDKTGFVWFATWNGLVRFDGYAFNTFKPILQSGGTIFSNRIYNIKMTATDNIWCVSSDNRLYLFDRHSNHFTDVLQSLPLVKDKKVKVLTPLAKGVTWVTFRDYSCLRLHDGDFRKGYTYWAAGSKALLGSHRILDIVQDSGGDEWILTDRGAVSPSRKVITRQVFRYVQRIGKQVYLVSANGHIVTLDTHQQFHQLLPASAGFQVNCVTSTASAIVMGTNDGVTLFHCASKRKTSHSIGKIIYLHVDSKGRTWAFGNGNTVWLISANGNDCHTLTATPAAKASPMKNPQLIFENADRQVILKPEGGVLSYYDEAIHELKDCRFYQNNEETTYSPTEISKYLIDHQGNLWLFQKNAANSISFHPDNFTHWQTPSKTEVRAMMLDSMGRKWLSDRSNALFLWQSAATPPIYITPSGQQTSAPIPFSKEPVYCLTEDRQHRIWVGTKGDGVYLLTPTNSARTAFQIDHFRHDSHDVHSLHSDTIWNILQDSRGTVWLSSYEQGLSCATLHNGKLVFSKVKGLPNGVKIRCMAEAQPGIFLIGTTNGLLTADFRIPHQPVFYQNAYRKETWGLKGNDIMRIVKCRNRYYVCVFGSGVSEILSNNLLSNELHFRNYLIPSNATADQIKTAISDGKNIWLASSQAIVRFAADRTTYTVFDRSNFIGYFNFAEGAPVMVKENGRERERESERTILMGTTDGVVAFSPLSISTKTKPHRIAFTGIQYQNDMNISPLNDIQSLTVAPDERSFSLYLSTLNYDEMGDIPFRYRLEGYDNGWNYTGENQHAVIYNNLPPGDYTLVVQAMSDNGTWDDNARRISIHVTPRFVETIWFKFLLLALVIAVFIAMGYAIVYLSRMRNLLQKKYSLLMAVDDFSTDIKIEQTLGIKTEDDGREFLKKSIAFFEANIGNRNFVIEDLARHLGMSRTAYYNKMKSVTGLSPVDFVKQMRIKKALKLLENRSLSISDVAYKTGFSDPKYFSRCFKAEMGMTPTQYVSSLPADTLS